MAGAGLTKWKERVASMQQSASRMRVRQKTERIEDTVVQVAAAYALGSIERRATTGLPTIFGLDPKLTWGALFAALAMSTSGRANRALNSTSNALLTCYGYGSGLGQGYTIRGEDAGGF